MHTRQLREWKERALAMCCVLLLPRWLALLSPISVAVAAAAAAAAAAVSGWSAVCEAGWRYVS